MFRSLPATHLLDIDARRICIIKPSALGDVVQTMPLLRAFEQRFPGADIAWVLNRELSGLLEGAPGLTEIIPFDRHGSWSDGLHLLATLRRRRFDLVFDLQGLLRTGLMTAVTGASVRVGLETAREGASLACNCLIPQTGRGVPAHARYWRVAEALGVPGMPGNVDVTLSATDCDWARDRLSGFSHPVVAVHPGARWETKRWPVEKFAEVAARTARHFGASIVVVGSRGEFPLAAEIVERVTAQGGKGVNLAGATTLKQLAAVLGSADLMVSNDSGPMHLAAGLGVPVVGLFTCTSPLLSGPDLSRADGPHHELVATTVPCAASYCKTCPHPAAEKMICMHELSIERVRGAIGRAMQRQDRIARSA